MPLLFEPGFPIAHNALLRPKSIMIGLFSPSADYVWQSPLAHYVVRREDEANSLRLLSRRQARR